MKPQTLMIAIQCVAAEIKLLDAKLDSGEVENEVETEELLVSYDLALADLQSSYEAADSAYSGLPSFDELVGNT